MMSENSAEAVGRRNTVDEILDLVKSRDGEEVYAHGLVERNFFTLPVVIPDNGTGWVWDDGYYRKYLHTELPDGTNVEAVWSVAPSPEGNLTHFDEDVLIALQQLAISEDSMDERGMVSFSLRRLQKIMGMHHGGRNLEAIKSSLRKWATTTFISDRAFWSEEERRRISKSISFITDFEFDERESAFRKDSHHIIHFGEIVRRSIEAGYVCELDLVLLWELDNPTARALYRFIQENQDSDGRFKAALVEVHEALGMSCKTYPSTIKQSLARPERALVSEGFLSGVEHPEKGVVRYTISPAYRELQRMVSSGLQNLEDIRLVGRLANVKGISRKEATKLVLEYGAEYCAYYLDALPYQEGIRNPAGWLKGALREGYELADYQLPPSHLVGGGQGTLFETREQEQGRRWEGYEGFFNKGEGSGGSSTSEYDGASGSGSTPLPAPAPDPEAAQVWDQVLEAVSDRINAPSLNTWFKGAVPVDLKGDILTLSVSNTFARDYIQSRFLQYLQSSLSEVLGRRGEITLVDREEG